MNDGRTLTTTLTGEPFQPARVHYDLLDENELRASFSRLQCVRFDAARDRWVWLYDNEAEGLEFKIPRTALPPNKQPVILGSILVRSPRMLVDVRSFDRAVKAIVFLDRHIGRSTAKATHVSLVNRLFDASEGVHLMRTFERFFEGGDERVERLPLSYYEDGINPLKAALAMRGVVALEHWKGNTSFTMSDAIREVTRRI